MPVLLRKSGDLPEPAAYRTWFPVTGACGRGSLDKKHPGLGPKLHAAFDNICRTWINVAAALGDAPGAELAYATTCAGYGSDFGLMMAWGRLVEDLAEEPETCLVVCDDPWLFRHLATLSGVAAGRAPSLWTATGRLRLRGLAARLRLGARLLWAVLTTRSQRGAADTGGPAILVYGHPQSTADDDAYFGPMLRKVPKLKRVLHTDCGPRRAKSLAADGRTASLHAWGNPWRLPGLLWQRWRPRREHLQGPFGWLVRRAAEKEAGGGAHGMNAWQRYCQEAWLADTRPTVVAWPWENHGWERAFCRQARNRNVATVGSQHTVIGPHQLNYNPATNIDAEFSLPDTLVCDGPAYRDQLEDWGISPDRMKIGGSLRIKQIDGEIFDADGPCFVALSANQRVASQQIDAVKAAAGRFRFLVKEHPMYPLTFEETDSIHRTDKTIGEQPSLSAVFFSTGTSGLEALLAGIPTFQLLPEDMIAVDILPDFLSAVPVTAGGLTDALGSAPKRPNVEWGDVLAPVDWDLWRQLLGTGRADEAEPSPMNQEKIA